MVTPSGISGENLRRKMIALKEELEEAIIYSAAVGEFYSERDKASTAASGFISMDEARQTAIARIAAIPFKERANWRNYSNVALITSEIAKREGKALEQVEAELLAQLREMEIRGI